MMREDIRLALENQDVVETTMEIIGFALDIVRRHNEECANIVNAARYEAVDLRSLVARIRELKP